MITDIHFVVGQYHPPLFCAAGQAVHLRHKPGHEPIGGLCLTGGRQHYGSDMAVGHDVLQKFGIDGHLNADMRVILRIDVDNSVQAE